jgi:hypothetical protein
MAAGVNFAPRKSLAPGTKTSLLAPVKLGHSKTGPATVAHFLSRVP